MYATKEIESYADLLLGHLRSMEHSLKKLPASGWDWTYAPPAPTPRLLAVHAWQWLQCDRQHILNSAVSTHQPVLEPPDDPSEICAAIPAEAKAWEELLGSLSADDLERQTCQFGHPKASMTVRQYIGHMTQNVIYKHGQFATIFFALGLDGEDPYDAPLPNPIYRERLGIG